jgi:hypothetical protein
MFGIIQKLKEYNRFCTGAWFTAEIMDTGTIILKYYYPLTATKTIYVFDTEEEFLSSNCQEILIIADFIQVKDK